MPILDQHGQPWVDPKQAQTQHDRRMAMSNSFSNTSRDRTRGGSRGPIGSVNAHRDSRSLQALIQDCQQAARNDLIAAAIMAARADAIVGNDPIFEAQSDDEEWNTSIEERFAEWCSGDPIYGCDVTGTMSFAQICSSIVNSWDDSGGVLINKYIAGSKTTARCKLETIEILRLVNKGRSQDTPTMHGGVEISEVTGAATGYYIGEWNSQGTVVNPATEVTDASNIWLLNNPRGQRPGQHRTEPMLARVLDRLETIDQSTEASWDAYQLASMIALFIKRESLEGPSTQEQMEHAAVTGGLARTAQEARERGVWAPGAVMDGLIGESIETINPSHPVTGFDAMLWTELQNIFAAMDMPPELVSMRFIKNYAASRSAIAVAWRRIQFYQQALITRFMIPVYRWWVTNEMMAERVKETKNWRRCAWHLPMMPVLDPEVETNGLLLALSGGLMNHDKALRIIGSGDRETFMTKFKKQSEQNTEAGLAYGQPVQVTRSEQVVDGETVGTSSGTGN